MDECCLCLSHSFCILYFYRILVLGDPMWLQSNHEQAIRQDYNLFFRRSSPNQVGQIRRPRRDKRQECFMSGKGGIHSLRCHLPVDVVRSLDGFRWQDTACSIENCSGKPGRFNACTFYTNVNHDTEEMHELTEAPRNYSVGSSGCCGVGAASLDPSVSRKVGDP